MDGERPGSVRQAELLRLQDFTVRIAQNGKQDFVLKLRSRRSVPGNVKETRIGRSGAVLQERGDTIAFPDPQVAQRMREPVALGIHAAGAVLVTLEVEVGPVGIGGKAAGERLEHGRLRPFRHGPDTSVTSAASSKPFVCCSA